MVMGILDFRFWILDCALPRGGAVGVVGEIGSVGAAAPSWKLGIEK
jgi:hypothetical protein